MSSTAQPPAWFSDLIAKACDTYTECMYGEAAPSKKAKRRRRQAIQDMPLTHCYWLITADGIEALRGTNDPNDLDLHDLERAWSLQQTRQAVLMNVYPGVVGDTPDRGLAEWDHWAEPRYVRITAGPLASETFGPLHGYEGVENFIELTQASGMLGSWDDFELILPDSGSTTPQNPFTRLRELVSR